MVCEVIPHHPIGDFLLKCNLTKVWNNLPQIITQQNTHGELKNNFFEKNQILQR